MTTKATFKQRNGVILIFTAGLFQGLTLVSFPALSSVLKMTLRLSDSAYGVLFLPQVLLTAVGALVSGGLSRRLGLPKLLKLSFLTNGLSQLALLLAVALGEQYGLALLILGTSLLGFGFGLSAAPLNRYPVIFFPSKSDSALTALHTLIGAGLALGPLLVGLLVETDQWRLFVSGLIASATALLIVSFLVYLPPDKAEAGPNINNAKLIRSPALWLLFLIASTYAVCEGLFSNWAVLFLQEDKLQSPQIAGAALSSFWAALALGRLLTS